MTTKYPDTCKFCDSRFEMYSPDGKHFVCGSLFRPNDGWDRGFLCVEALLKRYEALFPIPPWSTEPISDETCLALGMVYGEDHKIWWMDRTGDGIHVEMGNEGMEVWQMEDNAICHEWCKTAGQLACLIAARKGAVK